MNDSRPLVGAFAWASLVTAGLAPQAVAAPLAIPYVGEIEGVTTPSAMVDVRILELDGHSVWSTSCTVGAPSGVFTLVLGDDPSCVDALPLDTNLFSGDGMLLEFTINGTVLQPPQLIRSVPYALQAEDAQAASGNLDMPIAGDVSTNGGVAAVVGEGTHFDAIFRPGDAIRVRGDGPGGPCPNDYVGIVVDKVGNTSCPITATSLCVQPVPTCGVADSEAYSDGRLFEVRTGAGDSRVEISASGHTTFHRSVSIGSQASNVPLTVHAPDGSDTTANFVSDDAQVDVYFQDQGPSGPSAIVSGVKGNLVLQKTGGSVGVGTTNPQFELDVSGDVRYAGRLVGPQWVKVANLGTCESTLGAHGACEANGKRCMMVVADFSQPDPTAGVAEPAPNTDQYNKEVSWGAIRPCLTDLGNCGTWGAGAYALCL